MARYNHAYVIAFSLESNHERGDDVDARQLRAALITRIGDLDREDTWVEAAGAPFDSHLDPEGDAP